MSETNHHRIFKSDREKAVKDWYLVYEINGRKYKFENIYIDETGVPYGYCRKTRRWAWLYLNAVSHYGKNIDMIPAILLENSGRLLNE